MARRTAADAWRKRLSRSCAGPATPSADETGTVGHLVDAHGGGMRVRRLDDHDQCDACPGYGSAAGRNTDLVSLLHRRRCNAELTRQLTDVRKQVDELAARSTEESDLAPKLSREEHRVGLTAVSGPAVTVTLDDAPSSVAANGIEPDLLVVHQQAHSGRRQRPLERRSRQ